MTVLKAAQEEALSLLRDDPALEKPEHAKLAGHIAALFDTETLN